MLSEELLEPAIQRIGRTLVERSKPNAAKFLSQRWWNDLLLDWGMHDEDFKVRLFRFVDVLPMLKTDEQFSRLLAEYFGHAPILPKPLKWVDPATPHLVGRRARRSPRAPASISPNGADVHGWGFHPRRHARPGKTLEIGTLRLRGSVG